MTENPDAVRRAAPSWAIGTIAAVVALVAGFVILNALVYRSFSTPSMGMSPTLPLHGLIETNRSKVVHDGDIVVFRSKTWSETRPDSKYVKRVIALGGQTVSGSADGKVTVDGKVLDEPYAAPDSGDPFSTFGPVTVPAGRMWVLGDNRGDSADSRAHSQDGGAGTVPVSGVVGVVQLYGTRGHVYKQLLGQSALLALPLGLVVTGIVALRRRRTLKA